jgi:hypothetical protein
MKLSFLSKSISAFGLLAVLSASFGASIQQTAKAQSVTEADSQAQSDAEYGPITLCTMEAMGGDSFSEFQGIEFSPEQEKAYRQAVTEYGDKDSRLADRLHSEPDFDGTFNWLVYEEADSDRVQAAIDATYNDEIPNSLQIDALQEQYGQYAQIDISSTYFFTQEQLDESYQNAREYEAAILAFLTPEQQQVYQGNLAIGRAVEACDPTVVNMIEG